MQTALSAVQSDLTDLLAQNNVFTGTLTINSASTLTAAESLGDKITIVSGDVVITQSSTAIDAAKLQAVVDKIVTVTGSLSYTHSGTGVTAVNFSNLSGVGNITIDQEAAISLPELVSAANANFVSDTKVTSFSAPKLQTVTSLTDINFSNATEVNLDSFKYETGNKTLSITAKSGATLSMSSFTTVDPVTLKQSTAYDLTLRGPKIVTLPLFESGDLDTDGETVTLVKMAKAPTLSATKLKELHMHNLKSAISLTSFTKLETLDIIGTYDTTGVAATVSGPRATNVTLTGATGLENLTLAGALGNVSIGSASSLTSVSTSGGMRSFTLTGATDLTSLTLGHGPNASSTLKRSDLSITGATALTTLVADSINNVTALDISGNTALTSVSFAGLKDLATEASQSVVVKIQNNDLEAQSVQLPSASGVTPVVAGKVTTNSGITAMKVWLDKAIAAATSAGEYVKVDFDNVVEIVDADGEKYNANTTTKTASTGISATNTSVISTVEDAGWSFINVFPGTADTPTDYEVKSVFIALETEGTGLSYKPLVGAESVNVKIGGVTKEFGLEAANGAYTTIAAVKDAINAYNFGSAVAVTAALDAGAKSYNKIIYNNLATGAATAVAAGGSLTWQLGSSTTASGTMVTATGSTVAEIQEQLVSVIGGEAIAGSYAYSASIETISSVPYIVLTREITGTEVADLGKSIIFPTISLGVTDTAGYTQFGGTMSNVAATDYTLSVNQNNVAGLRVSIKNNSLTTALTANETVTITTASSGVMSNTVIASLYSGTNMVANKTVDLDYSAATSYDDGTDAGRVDATAWL